MGATSAREKRFWLLAAGWVVVVYSTLYIVRGPVTFLRERNLLRLSVAIVFILVAAMILRAVLKRRPGRLQLAVLVLGAVGYLIALARTGQPEERLHFIQYGVLAGLVYAALSERWSNRSGAARGAEVEPLRVPVLALVITSLAGWGDEGIQHLLPNRYYELRDVALNVVAGLMVAVLLYALSWARRLESRS